MKDILKIAFLVSVMIFSTGCENRAQYELIQTVDAIDKIELVRIERGDENMIAYGDTNRYIPIQEVSKEMYSEFISDFKSLDCYEYRTDPGCIFPGIQGIRISYSNGDYEVISEDAQSSLRGDRYRDYGYYYFDHDEFVDFLDKYFQGADSLS